MIQPSNEHRHARSCTTSRCRTTRSSPAGSTSRAACSQPAGEPPIRTTGFVVNPTIKTQYTESWFVDGAAARSASTGCVRARLRRHARRQPRAHRRREPLRRRSARRQGRSAQPELRRAALRDQRRHVELRRGHRRRCGASSTGGFSSRRTTATRSGTTRRRIPRPGQFQDNSEPGKGAQDVDVPGLRMGAGRCSTSRTVSRSRRSWAADGIRTTPATTAARSPQDWQVVGRRHRAVGPSVLGLERRRVHRGRRLQRRRRRRRGAAAASTIGRRRRPRAATTRTGPPGRLPQRPVRRDDIPEAGARHQRHARSQHVSRPALRVAGSVGDAERSSMRAEHASSSCASTSTTR